MDKEILSMGINALLFASLIIYLYGAIRLTVLIIRDGTIVRCKDCKYRDKVHTYRCTYLSDLILDDGDGFCSHGERVETEERKNSGLNP